MKARILFSFCLVLVGTLLAAEEKPPRRAAAEGADRPTRGEAGGLPGLERVLTDEQRETLREHMQAGGKVLRAAQQELMQLRRELNETVLAGKATTAMIKEKTEAIAKLEAEQLRARMTALSKIAATFTEEQRAKLREMGEQFRAGRTGFGPGPREGEAPVAREPAAPPPPEK